VKTALTIATLVGLMLLIGIIESLEGTALNIATGIAVAVTATALLAIKQGSNK
jgi:hypothetical protein